MTDTDDWPVARDCPDCQRYPDVCPLHTDLGEHFADGVPLPPEPGDPDDVPAPDAAEDPPALPPLTADDFAAAAQVHAAARRVHVVRLGTFARLGDEFDPRGRHVGCDGDPPGAGGCRAAPGEACKHPLGKFVSGFVHPSRVAAERRVFGMDA